MKSTLIQFGSSWITVNGISFNTEVKVFLSEITPCTDKDKCLVRRVGNTGSGTGRNLSTPHEWNGYYEYFRLFDRRETLVVEFDGYSITTLRTSYEYHECVFAEPSLGGTARARDYDSTYGEVRFFVRGILTSAKLRTYTNTHELFSEMQDESPNEMFWLVRSRTRMRGVYDYLVLEKTED